MSLLDQLRANKGTVSSALGKQLAKDILAGDYQILEEALKLIHFELKNVRSGAAKIIEKVAEEKPDLIAPHLSELFEALNYKEPQTTWMMIHTFGLCAHLQPDLARDIFVTATKYLEPTYGTVLRDRAITYLGYMGAVSEKDCKKCFPLLIESFENHPDRITRILESFERMIDKMDSKQKNTLSKYCKEYAENNQPAIVKWAKQIIKKTQ